MLTLEVTKRDNKKPESLRKEGKLPAVFYGRKEESTPVVVDTAAFESLFRQAGESTIISLRGVGDPKEALIHDVDFHPVTGKPRHVDFYVIEKGKKLTVDVPLAFVGEAPAVKSLGGILVKVVHELEIEALPKDLPHEIVVDVSKLDTLESGIAVKDLMMPEGVVALADPEEIVVAIEEPKEEEEKPSEIDMESIQVEAKGKKAETDTSEESTDTSSE